MRDLLVATTNKGKLAEFAEILGNGSGFRVRSAAEVLVPVPTVIEDGATFAANALKKARTIAREAMCLTLGDDSGLEVDALGGAPGVYSARFAGEGVTDAANRAELVRRLRALGGSETRFPARFRCALSVVDPLAPEGAGVIEAEGACEGSIVLDERGAGGFGYDALFVPEGFDRTFAELASSEKHALSHRARALAALGPKLAERARP
jgi:XTP/dITP diphosphohydrolase